MSTFEVSVSASFRARHAVATPSGPLEPPHEHDWRVEAVYRADALDADGFVVDFLAARMCPGAASPSRSPKPTPVSRPPHRGPVHGRAALTARALA